MACLVSESLELKDEIFSKIRATRVFSTIDYKVNKLYNFGFVEQVDTRPTTPKSVSP